VNSSGSLTGSTSYDAWGNPSSAGGLTASTPFGYAGGYTDATGLIYLIHRYYDPSAGQFLSIDPLVSQTLQPYGYASSDPTVSTDPSGQSPTPLPGGSSPCSGTFNCTNFWLWHTSLSEFQVERNFVCGNPGAIPGDAAIYYLSHKQNCWWHGNTNGKRIDWSSDGCSKPAPFQNKTFNNWQGRNTTIHIWQSCERHDFGYRNYEEQHRFTAYTKHLIDENFRTDFNKQCDTIGSPGSNECHALAASYFEGVEVGLPYSQ
jgi:RHS repeat-associated protein